MAKTRFIIIIIKNILVRIKRISPKIIISQERCGMQVFNQFKNVSMKKGYSLFLEWYYNNTNINSSDCWKVGLKMDF